MVSASCRCPAGPVQLHIHRVPLCVKHTDWHRRLLGKVQNMEGLDSTLKDLTPLLSKYMDASGNLDPSKAPPDMTVSLHNTAELLLQSHNAYHRVANGVR